MSQGELQPTTTICYFNVIVTLTGNGSTKTHNLYQCLSKPKSDRVNAICLLRMEFPKRFIWHHCTFIESFRRQPKHTLVSKFE